MFDDQIVNQKGKRIPLNPEDHSFIGVAQLGVVVSTANFLWEVGKAIYYSYY